MDILYGSAEAWNNNFEFRINHHLVHQPTYYKHNNQIVYETIIPKLFNICKCPIKFMLIMTESDEKLVLLDWKITHHKGQNVLARFDVLSQAYNPVWLSFGPRRVRFGCGKHKLEYQKRKKNRFEVDVYIHRSKQAFIDKEEKSYRLIGVEEFTPTVISDDDFPSYD